MGIWIVKLAVIAFWWNFLRRLIKICKMWYQDNFMRKFRTWSGTFKWEKNLHKGARDDLFAVFRFLEDCYTACHVCWYSCIYHSFPQLSNYSSMEGILYCKPHYEQLFKETGSFSKNFQSRMAYIVTMTNVQSLYI